MIGIGSKIFSSSARSPSQQLFNFPCRTESMLRCMHRINMKIIAIAWWKIHKRHMISCCFYHKTLRATWKGHDRRFLIIHDSRPESDKKKDFHVHQLTATTTTAISHFSLVQIHALLFSLFVFDHMKFPINLVETFVPSKALNDGVSTEPTEQVIKVGFLWFIIFAVIWLEFDSVARERKISVQSNQKFRV